MKSVQALLKIPLHWLQNALRYWPSQYCLISGPPRSGTTALQTWLSDQRGVAGFGEVRMLITAHQGVEQINRFRPLNDQSDLLFEQHRRMVHAFYSRQRILIGKRLVFEKSPLEPIGFPDMAYQAFLKNVRTMFPHIKYLFIFRNPVPTIHSMHNRSWGGSRIGGKPISFSIDEHIKHWNQAIEALHAYKDDPNSYFCSYERLISEPGKESEAIATFLGIRLRNRFVPQPAQALALNQQDRDKIMQGTQAHRNLINNH